MIVPAKGEIRSWKSLREHVTLLWRNAVRRDADPVECRDDFCHGLPGGDV